MRKLYCYILIGIISALLFPTMASAATSYASISVPVQNSGNISILSTTYSSLPGILIDAEDIQGTSQSYWKFEPNYAIDLSNMPSGYINGQLFVDITVSSDLTNGAYSTWEVSNLANTDSMHTAITWARNNTFRIIVFLDNYNTSSGSAHIGDLKLTYMDNSTAYSPTNSASFSCSMSIAYNNLTRDTVVSNDRSTALLYSAITQATGPQLSDIINSLSQIKNQDTTYYTMLVNNLAQLHTDNQTLHNDLSSILSELDLDFTAVQTVLDLFPSYRTQVLQYWQELIQMNAAQSSQAAEMESEYADRDNQSDQLLGGLDSMQFPTISSGDLNVLKNVDTEGKTNFFGLISLITNNSLVTNILLIVVTGMIAGYALYGKKN